MLDFDLESSSDDFSFESLLTDLQRPTKTKSSALKPTPKPVFLKPSSGAIDLTELSESHSVEEVRLPSKQKSRVISIYDITPEKPKPKNSVRSSSFTEDLPKTTKTRKRPLNPAPQTTKSKKKKVSDDDLMTLSDSENQTPLPTNNPPQKKTVLSLTLPISPDQAKPKKADAMQQMFVVYDTKLYDFQAVFQEAGCSSRMDNLSVKGSFQWLRLNEPNVPQTSDNSSLEYLGVLFTGVEFASLIHENLVGQFYSGVQLNCPGTSCVFIIEGIDNYFKQIQTDQARAYRSEVMAGMNGTQGGAKKKKAPAHAVTREQIEDECLNLQIEKRCQIIHTQNRAETIEYILRLTTKMSLLPFKTVEAFDGFCASATRKSTKTLADAWVAQLEQIQSVSHRIALAIAAVYPTVNSLVSVYNSSVLTIEEKKDLLKNIDVSGVGGQARKLGPALSARIYSLFTSNDGTLILN